MFTLLVLAALSGHADVRSSLRPFRTYYFAEGDLEPAHQYVLKVWRANGRREVLYVGAKDVADVETLRPDQLKLAAPPHTGEAFSLPPAAAAIGSALDLRLRQLFPDLRKLELNYDGLYRRLDVREVVPFDAPGSTARRGRRVDLALKYTANGLVHAFDPRVSPAGARLFDGTKLSPALRLLDAHLPPDIDGSSLFALAARHEITTARQAETLGNIISLLERPRVVPGPLAAQLDAVHARQGGELVPRDFRQSFTLTISLSGRMLNHGEVARQALPFHVPIGAIVHGHFAEVRAFPEFGLSVRIAVDPVRGLQVVVTDATGDEIHRSAYQMVLDGPRLSNPESGHVMYMGSIYLIPRPTLISFGERARFDEILVEVSDFEASLATGHGCAAELE